MVASELERFQRWFLEVVTHPDGVSAGATAGQPWLPQAIEDVCQPSERLAATDRVGIYAGMYFLRLCEVLSDDFPALCALLGPEASERLQRAYLVRHPSSHPNLNQLGRDLAGWLADEAPDVPARAFAVELARLERAVQEVFDAPRATSLSTDELLGIPPEAWAETGLETAPALRLLAFEHPTNAWYQEWREKESAPAVPEPSSSWLALYRRDWRVWRQPLAPEAFALLGALQEGATLGAALESLAERPELDLEEVGRSLTDWFREWSGLGFFVGLR